jgi:hypothetical protein
VVTGKKGAYNMPIAVFCFSPPAQADTVSDGAPRLSAAEAFHSCHLTAVMPNDILLLAC